MTLVSVGWTLALPPGTPYRPVNAVAVALAAASPLALLWRQSLPLVALGVTCSAIVINAAAGFGNGFLGWPAWIALFTVFAADDRGQRVTAALFGIVGTAGYLVFDRGDPAGVLPNIAFTLVFAAVAGELSRRRALAAGAQERRAVESDQRALAAERLLMQERGRLARELHDSLGHTVNVMVLQAGVGRRVFGQNPGYAQEALTAIESVGRGALGELDRLLKVLQPEGGTRSPTPFAPTAADLEQLVERVRATGREVELRMDGELSPGCARALYRILQEALTNALRHTTTGRIRVEVTQVGDRVQADVVNEGDGFARPVPGRGLVNMRERARLEGGELQAGPVEGGFRVRAVLPVSSGVTA